MPSSTWPALVADIGGTNARFAMVDGPGAAARDVEVLSTGDHPTLEDAIEAYLKEKGAQRPRAACLAVAGPVTGDLIKFTNHPWEFSINETMDALGLARLAVINDFEALALALPRLAADELLAIGGGAAVDGWPKAVLGPGTGLGVAAAVPTSAGWEALAG
jgi:glucokinase